MQKCQRLGNPHPRRPSGRFLLKALRRASRRSTKCLLFPLLTFYTAAYMALMVADFFLKGAFDLPEGIMPVYIALLGAYAADKEIRRWVSAPEPARKGSLFVYLWLLFFIVAYIIYSFRPEYVLPGKLVAVCLQVLGIFFGSKASKYFHATRQGSGQVDRGRERIVLDLIAAKGQVTRRDVMERLGVSDNTVNRLLRGLESRNLVQHMGEGRGSYYVLTQRGL